MSELWLTEGQYKILTSVETWLEEVLPVRIDSLNLTAIEDDEVREEAYDQLFYDMLVPIFYGIGISEKHWATASEFVAARCAATTETENSNESTDEDEDGPTNNRCN
jgi:hypothetical protein|tara:strand:+ start:3522 stop:3842 length:321 start_codon:yes stop_codon:yes gene_type:complete